MAFSAVAAFAIGASVYSADVGRKTANKQADKAIEQAKAEQAQQMQIAKQQQTQAEAAQAQSQAFEMERQATLAAAQKQLSADEALSAQNQGVSELTPDVQLAANTEDGGSAAARKRRASFRPEYASGVTI